MEIQAFTLFCLIVLISAKNCPSPILLHPCKCFKEVNRLMLVCEYDLDKLNSVFKRIDAEIAPKHFDILNISDAVSITFDQSSRFMHVETRGITFNEINLNNMYNLFGINSKSFASTSKLVKKLTGDNLGFLESNPKKYNLRILESRAEHYNLFDWLNSFTNLERLTFNPPKVQAIPRMAFRLSKLKLLEFRSMDMLPDTMSLAIGDDAFVGLEQLNYLGLSENRINWISKKALNFNQSKVNHLMINLSKNQLNDSSFAEDSLTCFNTSVTLNLEDNEIIWLNESVFKPFLDAGNSLLLANNRLNCSDCRNAWLIEAHYEKLVSGAFCSNRDNIFLLNPSKWQHCVQIN